MKKSILITGLALTVQLVKAQLCPNCGMGTNVPQAKLEIRGCTSDSTTAALKVTNSTDTANGYPLLFVRNDKRIGINTKYPKNVLHVQSAGTGGINIVNLNASTQPSLGFFMNSTSVSNFVMGVDGADGNKFKIGTAALNTNTRLTIDATGNLGVGTTSPEGLLHVEKAASAHGLARFGTNGNIQVMLEDLDQADATGPYKYLQNGAGNLYIGTATRSAGLPSVYTDQLVLTNSGNVGIGTGASLPNSKLEVVGNIVARNPSGSGINLDGVDLAANNYSGVNIYAFDNTAANNAKYGYVGYSVAGSPVMMFRQNNWGGSFTWGNTTSPGGLNNYQEKMKLDASGRLGISTTTPVSLLSVQGGSANWSETVPGLLTGTLHLDPGATTDHFGNAITFGASDHGNGELADAGIYVRTDGAYGSKMYFGTTDSYATGSQMRMMINHDGKIGINTTTPKSTLEINGSLSYKVVTQTGVNPYVPGNETVIIVDDTYVQLPAASAMPGRVYIVKCVNNESYLEGGLDGDPPAAWIVGVGSTFTVVSNGTGWYRID